MVFRKETTLKAIIVSGDGDASCLAKDVDEYGMAKKRGFYLNDLLPDELNDAADRSGKNLKRWNIKITVEAEEAK
jgi:hypothetical protein